MKEVRIGLLIDTYDDLCEYEITQGIYNYFKSVDINIIIFEGGHNFSSEGTEDQYIRTVEMIKTSNISGLIIFSEFFLDHIKKKSLIEYIKSFIEIPIVSIGIEIENVTSISINEDKSIKDLIKYVISKETTPNIAFMFGPVSNELSNNRLRLINSELKKNGIQIMENKIYHLSTTNYLEVKKETHNLLKNSITIPRIIICFDDYTALAVIDYLEDIGVSVPGNIIVTGFDNLSINNPYKSKLITVKQPYVDLGYEAGKLLSRKLENQKVPQNTTLYGELITNSTDSYYFDVKKEAEKIIIDYSKFKSKENTKKIIQSVIKRITVSNEKNKEILLDIFYAMTIDDFLEDPLSINNHIKKYLDNSNLTIKDISEIRFLLDMGLSIIYYDYGISSLLYQIFSVTLNLINELLISNVISDSYNRDNFYWKQTIGSQIMLRCNNFSDLINNLPHFTEKYNCKNFYLFIYKKDKMNTPFTNKLPDKTKLIYAQVEGETINVPITFNTQKLLPSWDIISKRKSYLFMMLFYNKIPVGYMFIDYSPETDPKKYLSMKINLETAIYSIARLEDTKVSMKENETRFVDKFSNIKESIQNINNIYNNHKSSNSSSKLIEKLGVELYSINDTVKNLFVLEEEIDSFDFKSMCNLSEKLALFFPKYTVANNIFIEFDPYAVDFIFKSISNYTIEIDDVSTKLENNSCYLEILFYHSFNNEQNTSWNKDDNDLPILINLFSSINRIIEKSSGTIKVCSIDDNKTLLILSFNLLFQIQSTQDNLYSFVNKDDCKVILINDNYLLADTLGQTINFKNKFYKNVLDINMQEVYETSITIIVAKYPEISSKNYNMEIAKYKLIIDNGIPVIFFSSKNSKKLVHKAYELGGIYFLSMPFSNIELSSSISNIYNLLCSNKKKLIQHAKNTLDIAFDTNNLIYNYDENRIKEYLKRYGLSSREIEITLMIINKQTHRDIADKINLTEQYIRNLSHKIYKKCNVKGKNELMELVNNTI